MWLALSSSAASCGAAVSWFDVAAQQGCRVGFFLLCSEGLKRVLEGWGGDLVGAVVGWGVLALLVWSALALRGRVNPVHPGCKD